MDKGQTVNFYGSQSPPCSLTGVWLSFPHLHFFHFGRCPKEAGKTVSSVEAEKKYILNSCLFLVVFKKWCFFCALRHNGGMCIIWVCTSCIRITHVYVRLHLQMSTPIYRYRGIIWLGHSAQESACTQISGAAVKNQGQFWFFVYFSWRCAEIWAFYSEGSGTAVDSSAGKGKCAHKRLGPGLLGLRLPVRSPEQGAEPQRRGWLTYESQPRQREKDGGFPARNQKLRWAWEGKPQLLRREAISRYKIFMNLTHNISI